MLLEPKPQHDPVSDPSDEAIVQTLESYRHEAVNARKTGPNDRDSKWKENIDLYWGRHDFSTKANWQSKEVLPEVPGFVDRFAAALKEALVSIPTGFYTVHDPADAEGDMAQAIKRATDVWLSRSGQNHSGQVLDFSHTFEEQVKLGAIMAMSSVVLWKNDVQHGRVAVETSDPRNVWFDPTGRGLYRIRRTELDRHDLIGMANATDGRGEPIFNLPALEQLVAFASEEERQNREAASGHGSEQTSSRVPVVMDEYIATVLDNDGRVTADRSLMVVANEQFLIRGPEPIPFWHGSDWLVYSPLIVSPLSIYGRSYMEDFGDVAGTFIELTNLIIDAARAASLNVLAMVPEMLLNPGQVSEGVKPGKVFYLEAGFDARQFADHIELGKLPQEAVTVWQALKNELREAAKMSEIGIGQFAPHSRTSATEVASVQQSSSALIRSVAQTVETRWLDPTLDRVWKTGMQHVQKDDPAIRAAMGGPMFEALLANRREIVRRNVTFQARGLSMLIQKSRMLNSLLQILQIVAANEILLQEFLRTASIEKLVQVLFELSDIDLDRLNVTDRERAIRSVAQPLQERQNAARSQPSQAGPDAQQQVQDIAQLLGA